MDMANKLDLFLTVEQHGSFKKAADFMNIDRSALSKQIKNLDDGLGVRLLNRTTRSISVTNVGTEILKNAATIRDILDDTQRIADTYHTEPRGTIRIAGPSLFGRLYLTNAVNNFLAKYPFTNIELVLDDEQSDIINNRFDIALRVGPIRDSNFIAVKLADKKRAILASRSFIY